MQYEPIKDKLHSVISLFPALRSGFFLFLDILLLRQRYVKREIREFGQEDMAFYDAGAGFCQYSDFVLKRYPKARVFAVDLKTRYLRSYAFSQKARFCYQGADLVKFSPRGEYDLAIAIDILEHIEDDIGAMRNLYRALKTGGNLIVSTPSDFDEAARFTAEHVRPGYCKADLEVRLKSVGFSIQKSIYSYGKWGALSWRLIIRYPLALQAKSRFFLLLMPLWYLSLYPLAAVMMHWDMKMHNAEGNGIILVCKKD